MLSGRSFIRFISISLVLFFVSGACIAADFYVSSVGNDLWSGMLSAPNASGTDGPFATIVRAQSAVRQLKQAQPTRTVAIVVQLRTGDYRLSDKLFFQPEDSGTSDMPVIYQAYPGESPVISGGRRLNGWSVGADGRWQLYIPEVENGQWNFSQLWVNGERRYRARLPKAGYYTIETKIAPSQYSPDGNDDRFGFFAGEINSNWSNLNDVEITSFHYWEVAKQHIASINDQNRIVRLSGSVVGNDWAWNLSPGTRFIVENVKEALVNPGEWYLDKPTGMLTYIPYPGENPHTSVVYAPVLDQLVRIQGNETTQQHVQYIQFDGLTFAHTNYNTPSTGYKSSQSASVVGGAISANEAHNCTFISCRVEHTGTYAIELDGRCRFNTIDNCELTDLGAGGVQIERFATHQYPDNVSYVSSNNSIRNCLIAHGGRVIPSGNGVVIGHSPYNTVEHNDIYDFYATGISCGFFYGNGAHDLKVQHNRIHKLGQGVLSDLGGIYSLAHQPNTIYDYNLIYDVSCNDKGYGGWGIYLDEYSQYVKILKNVVYNTTSGGFHMHHGYSNQVQNNIFAENGWCQLYRTRAETQRQFTFQKNIVYYDCQQWEDETLLGGDFSGSGYFFDQNLYWDASGRAVTFAGLTFDQWKAKNQDVHSKIADPLFVDPKNADFRLQPNSPAFSLGFASFDIGLAGRPGLPPPDEYVPPAYPVFADIKNPYLAVSSINITRLYCCDKTGSYGPLQDSSSRFAGLAISPNGEVYAALRSSLNVLRYDGENWSVYCTGPANPGGMTLDAIGNLYIVSESGGIYKFSAGAQPGSSATFVAQTSAGPRGIAYSNGFLWVACETASRVEQYDAVSGIKVKSINVPLPYGVTVDSTGEVHISSGTSLLKLTGNAFTQIVSLGSTSSGRGLAYADNKIFIADAGGRYRIRSYDLATGVLSDFTIDSIPGNPSYIAVRNESNMKYADSINYQGKLTTAKGEPVADGAYSFVFRFYNAPAEGKLIWSSSPMNVNTCVGLFSVMLGPIDSETLRQGNFWIETQVESEILSRTKVTASLFAINAQSAQIANTALSLSGSSGAKFNAIFNNGADFRTGSNSGVSLHPNEGVWYTLSDRGAKKNFNDVDTKEVLNKLTKIDISKWQYKHSENTHIGPMAQDFYSAFELGANNKSISTLDVDGVVYAAIQALYDDLKAHDKEIATLRSELAELKELIKTKYGKK